MQINQLKEDIKKNLLALTDPENGQHMIKDVIFKEDVYNGEFIDQIPDIYLLWEEGYGAVSEKARLKSRLWHKGDNFLGQRNWSGFHTMDGIFAISGPETRNGIKIKEIQMHDLFPTILYSMGLPLPGGLDGRSIKECFCRSIPEKHSSTMDIRSSTGGDTSGLSEEEKSIVTDQLKSLGYLE